MDKFKKWLKAAGIRAARTVAQTAMSVIGTAAVLSAVDWKLAISSALLAGVLSILMSIATGLPEVPDEQVKLNEPASESHNDE